MVGLALRIREESYAEYRREVERERLPRATRAACVVVAALSTSFLALDWIAFPELFFTFLVVRLALDVVLFGTFLAAHRFPVSSPILGCLAIGCALLAVIQPAGGLLGEYYVGLVLLFVGMPVFIPYSASQACVLVSVLLAGLAVPPLFDSVADWTTYWVHLFFPAAAAIECIASCAMLDSFGHKAFLQRCELEAARDHLRQLDTEKSRFTANVHHELRTPLTLMLAPLEAMRGGDFGELPARIEGSLRTMQSNGLRLLKLINNLLDLAKVESEQLGVRRVRLDVGRIVREVVEGALPMAERKGIRLDVEVAADLEPACVDPDALEKVLVNLIGNALKFTSEGGVRVGVEPAPEGVHLQVVDTGAGIPADQLERVFDRFAQVDASATRQHEGTGIGLSLVYELVRLHGGRVWAESEGPGRGTALHVVFPFGEADREEDEEVLIATSDGRTLTAAGSFEALASEMAEELAAVELGRFAELERTAEKYEGQKAPIEASPEELPRHPPGTPEVVVADDNLEMRRLLAFLVGREFVVRSCRNGREALEAVRERLPALVLTDVMMPEMSGTELCKALKDDPTTCSVPVMLVTSKAEREMKIEGLELGAEDYVTKPFHPRELMARVRSLVRIRELQREIGEQNASLEASNCELEVTLRELKEAEVQLVHAERYAAVGELAAGVAHEVNNPLNFARNSLAALRGYVDEMRGLLGLIASFDASDPERLRAQLEDFESKAAEHGMEDLSNDLGELVGIVTEGLDRTARLVGDLRDFAAPHRGTKSRVDVAAGLRSTLQLLGHRLREARADLEVLVPDALPPLEGDPGALNQVFLNLLKNAAEAIEENGGGRIRVWAGAEGDAVVVKIADEGPGVSEAARERLFEPFFTTKTAGKGTGLGLAICQRIIDEHGGSISMDSRTGEGTEVTVRLPPGESRDQGSEVGD